MSSRLPSFWRGDDSPMMSLQKEMDRLFQDFGKKWPVSAGFDSGFPAIDVHETDNVLCRKELAALVSRSWGIRRSECPVTFAQTGSAVKK